MFFSSITSKRGASKPLWNKISSKIIIVKLKWMGIGCIMGVGLLCMFFYIFDIHLVISKSSNFVLVGDTINTPKTENKQMPTFDFYHSLINNTELEQEKTKNNVVDNQNTINKPSISQIVAPNTNINNITNTIKNHEVYFLQIGIFKSLKQAQSTLAKLKELGYIAIIEKFNLHARKKRFRVEIGPFYNIKEFNKVQDKMMNYDIEDMLLQCRKKTKLMIPDKSY